MGGGANGVAALGEARLLIPVAAAARFAGRDGSGPLLAGTVAGDRVAVTHVVADRGEVRVERDVEVRDALGDGADVGRAVGPEPERVPDGGHLPPVDRRIGSDA